MSRDPIPEDQAIRDLAPLLARIAFALECLVPLRVDPDISVATCSGCGCTIVFGKVSSRVPCPACGLPTEVR